MSYLLAHDLGTSGNKACLYTNKGELIKAETVGYETYYLGGGKIEQNPEDWWKAIVESTRKLIEGIDVSEIKGISFSAQMMGLVCIDRDGRVLRNSMIHSDQRASEESRETQKQISEKDFFAITGHHSGPSYPMQKLMWVKKHEPEIYEKTYKVLNAKDYIVFRMTGKIATDYTDASSTNMFDVPARKWSEKLCRMGGIDMEKLPEVKDSTWVAGTLIPEVAAEMGLAPETKVVLGAGDGMCSSVGCGAIVPGKVYNYIGSSSWITGIFEKPPIGEKMYLEIWAHPAGPWANAGGTMQSAGSAFEWAADTLYGSVASPDIEKELAQTKPGSGGVIFLPYLNGERVPFWNEKARGTFVGISNLTTRADLLRAVLEGVAFNLKMILDETETWMDVKEITVLGGTIRNKLFCQILADVYGIPVVTLKNTSQITSLGAAIIAGVGCGEIDSFESTEGFCTVDRRYYPEKETAEYYAGRSGLLRETYESLVNVFEKLN